MSTRAKQPAKIDPKKLCEVPEVVELVVHLRRVIGQCPHLSVGLCDPNDPIGTVRCQETAICESLEKLGFAAQFGDEDVGKSKRKPRRLLWVGVRKKLATRRKA